MVTAFTNALTWKCVAIDLNMRNVTTSRFELTTVSSRKKGISTIERQIGNIEIHFQLIAVRQIKSIDKSINEIKCNMGMMQNAVLERPRSPLSCDF